MSPLFAVGGGYTERKPNFHRTKRNVNERQAKHKLMIFCGTYSPFSFPMLPVGDSFL